MDLPDDAVRAFNDLKEQFKSAPLLVHFDPERRIRIEPDASGFAISGILSQLRDDDQWHPVAFWSRKLRDAEYRYMTRFGTSGNC